MLLPFVVTSSALELEGEAFELFFPLVIGLRQCAQDLFVWVLIFPARHTQARRSDLD